MSKFNILNKAEILVDYILTVIEKSPKKVRLDIIPELRKKVILIDEYIVRANSCAINGDTATEESISKRLHFQNECLVEINILNSFLEVAVKHNYITNKQLENATKLSAELYDMIKKWKESDIKRKQN